MLTRDVRPGRRSLRVLACAALLVTTPVALCGQARRTLPLFPSPCLANIPDSAMRWVEAYLQVDLADSADSVLLPGIDLLTQGVADHVRALLGAGPDTLPKGEPTVTWRGLDVACSLLPIAMGR